MSSRSDSKNITAEIVQKLTFCLPAILSHYPVVSAYLYGSQASGVTHPVSDIDVAIYIKPGSELTLNQELSIGSEIERSSNLKPVELRVLNDLPLTVQGEVLTKGVLLYSADENERIAFETRTTALYFDYLPHIEYFRNTFLESVKKRGIL